LTAEGRLEFLEALPVVVPQARTIDEVRAVLYNQTATGPEELYLMYRGLGWTEDIDRLAVYSLRVDLTILHSGLVGGEYIKTAGHYHPERYAEIYQVLSGRAHYLLQKPTGADLLGTLEDVVVVEAGPGDLLYVPPGYGHVTINPDSERLVMVNVVDATFASVYGPYRARHGAAYYEVREQGQPYWIGNEHYPGSPRPRLGRVTRPQDLGLVSGEPLYSQVVRAPRSLAFLSQPPGDGPRP
jgi:glucose-6-phosphate isomerase